MTSTVLGASCARSWVFACGPACGRLAEERQWFDQRSKRAARDSDRLGNVATLEPTWTFRTRVGISASPVVTFIYVYIPTGVPGYTRSVREPDRPPSPPQVALADNLGLVRANLKM
jgi:hypothetical protein